jgi:hypothetical protein
LDYKKEGSQSNSLSNWIGASLFLIVQSEALFTNFWEFQLAICSRRFQIAQSNLPIKIAILWDNIAMLLAREHPV